MAESAPFGAKGYTENPTQPSPVAWSQIFSQHESYLNRHLEICSKVQQHVPPKGDSFSAISSIIEGTQKLLGDMEKLRREFTSESSATRILSGKVMDKVDQQRAAMNGSNDRGQQNTPPPSDANNVGNTPAQSPLFFFDKNPATNANTLPDRSKNARKRSREEEENGSTTNWKRTKVDTSNGDGKGPDNSNIGSGDKLFTPTIEVDDISEEVEARLRLKEESRRRRKAKPQRKRKRDSSASAEGNQGENGDNARRNKRPKQGGGDGNGGKTAKGAPSVPQTRARPPKRRDINEATRFENGEQRPKRQRKA